MRLFLVALLLVGEASFFPAMGFAADAGDWLGRIVSAAQRLTYSGTFVYESGGQTETSRITHVVDGSGERERLEVLDGSPREVIRINQEVRCFLPAERMVIVDRHGHKKAFPARLPEAFESLTKHYNIRIGETGRVAGFESQQLLLEPRDSLRYGHVLWADVATGLLLKSRMVNESNEPIEQFYFTQLQIGRVGVREALRTRFSVLSDQWRVHHAKTVDSFIDDGYWNFRKEIPGFRKTAAMKRQLQDGAPAVLHYVFSDGLAAISVFIEPRAGREYSQHRVMYSTGAISVYERLLGDFVIIVVGEVPLRTLELLGDGVDRRSK